MNGMFNTACKTLHGWLSWPWRTHSSRSPSYSTLKEMSNPSLLLAFCKCNSLGLENPSIASLHCSLCLKTSFSSFRSELTCQLRLLFWAMSLPARAPTEPRTPLGPVYFLCLSCERKSTPSMWYIQVCIPSTKPCQVFGKSLVFNKYLMKGINEPLRD